MARDIQDILNNCIERMLKGESIEDCLKAYPEHASELGPLLRTSATIRQKSFAIRPTPEFKDRVRSRLQDMLYAKAEQRRANVSFWHRRWAVALASVLVIFIAGIGTVAASANALPGEIFYPVKLTSEEIRLALTFSDLDKAKLHLQFAQRRAVEMVEVAHQGKSDKALLLAEKVASHVDRLEEILEAGMVRQAKSPEVFAPTPLPAPSMSGGMSDNSEPTEGDEGELTTMLSHSRARNLDKLQAALDKAPEELKPSLEQAIKNIASNYDKTIPIVESGPSP